MTRGKAPVRRGERSGGRRIWAAVFLLVVAVVLGVYGRSSRNAPLAEDAGTVWSNPAVSGSDYLGTILGRYEYAPDETPEAVRPIATLANRLRYSLFQEDRAGYVWSQLGLHALCAVLLGVLVRSAGGSVLGATFAAGAFAAHPAVTSSVLRLPGIAEQLALAFGLLHFHQLIGLLEARARSRRAIGSSVATLGLALLSKEVAFVFLPVSLALIWIHSGGVGRATTSRGRLAACLVGVSVASLVLRLVSLALVPEATQGAPAVHPDSGLSTIERGARGLASLPLYLRLLMFPQSLSYTYDFMPRIVTAGWSVAGAASLLILAAGACVSMLRRSRAGTLWMGLLTVALVAALGVLAPIGDYVSERLAYLLLPGLLGSIGWAADGIGRRWPGTWTAILGPVLGVAAIAGLGVRANHRAADYINEHALISATADRFPSAKAHFDRGNLFLSEGQFADARQQYEAALQIDQQLWMAWINLGAAYSREQDYSLAMRAYDRALEGAGDRPEYRVPMAKAHFNRALLLMKQNRNEEAVVDLQATIRVLPDHLRAHVNLAYIYRNSEFYDEQAIHHFNRAIELETTPEAKQRLEKAMDYIHERRERLETLGEGSQDGEGAVIPPRPEPGEP